MGETKEWLTNYIASRFPVCRDMAARIADEIHTNHRVTNLDQEIQEVIIRKRLDH